MRFVRKKDGFYGQVAATPPARHRKVSRKTKRLKQLIEPRPKVPRGKAKYCHRACQKKAIPAAHAPNGYLPVAEPVEKIYLYCRRTCRNAAVNSTHSMATLRPQWFRQTKPPGAALKNARFILQDGGTARMGKDCITIQLYV